MIAELAAISIENLDSSIFIVAVSIFGLTLLEVIVDYLSIKSSKVRRYLEGEPVFIIKNGKVNYKEMVKERYGINDLLKELRLKEIKSLEDVDYAILENNGSLSIFKKNNIDKRYPMPLIIDGKLEKRCLKEINKSISWLNNILDKKSLSIEDVYYAFYNKNSLFILKKEKNIN